MKLFETIEIKSNMIRHHKKLEKKQLKKESVLTFLDLLNS